MSIRDIYREQGYDIVIYPFVTKNGNRMYYYSINGVFARNSVNEGYTRKLFGSYQEAENTALDSITKLL